MGGGYRGHGQRAPRMTARFDAEAERQRQQGRDPAQLARRPRPERRRGRRVSCLGAGAAGITVHPRADARHITSTDVRDIARVLAPLRGRIEFNIEGDPRPDLVALVLEVRPDQCTLVPVAPGEVTSQAGWPADTPQDQLSATVRQMQAAGVRVSLFVDPDEAAVRWARGMGADRIELYTEPFARAFAAGARCREAQFCPLHGGGAGCDRLRPRHQRRARSRSRQSRAVPNAAAPRGGFNRPRPDQPRALRRARPRGTRLRRCGRWLMKGSAGFTGFYGFCRFTGLQVRTAEPRRPLRTL